MSKRGDHPPDPDAQRLGDLIAECILAIEQHGEAAVEPLLAKVPDLAARARQRLRALQASGLLPQPVKDPERIGNYRIRERLGAGGMGIVYLAEQHDEIERRVALKVINPGLDSREVLARFAVERQAMAMLDHQNIAKVLDAGQTDDGRPFLVMEYVAGVPITRYCDERRLPLPERLQLFCQVCEAVQHAHHKGLIHRDLKPSNILVADRDGRPWPMVIDFGVAKSVSGRLTDHSLRTVRGRMLGTPEYMSPEQAANELDVDTRADVFSLGVVLYELLTGTLPIDSMRLRSAAASELPRILRDADTPAPSRRITAMGDSATGAALLRHTDGPRLRRRLCGDLDWITLRALERDRNRRYGMPGELAADVQRHLANQPVSAGPPGAFYRWGKLYRRHRLQVISAAAVLLALLLGLGFSTAAWQAAAASARQSDADFEHALAAVERLVVFGDQRRVDEPQMDEVRRQVLQDALGFYQNLANGRSDVPRLQLRFARASARCGRLHQQLGEHQAALAALDDARARHQRLSPPWTTLGDLAAIESMRAQVFLSTGDNQAAEAALAAAVALWRQMPASTVLTQSDAANRLVAFGLFGRTLARRDAKVALRVFEEALAMGAPWLRGDVTDDAALANAMHIAVQHAALLVELGELAEGKTRAAALRDRLLSEWQRRAEPARQQLVDAATELGVLFGRLADDGGAIELLQMTATQQRWLCQNHPALTRAPSALGVLLANLANYQLNEGQLAAAATTMAECVRVLEALLARSPVDANRILLGKSLINQARALAAPRGFGGEVDQVAIAASLERGIGLLQALPEALRQERETCMALAAAHGQVARECAAAGRRDEAIAAMERSIAEYSAIATAAPETVAVHGAVVDCSFELAELLLDAQQWQRARDVLAQIDQRWQGLTVVDASIRREHYDERAAAIRLRAGAGLGDADLVLTEVDRHVWREGDWTGRRTHAQALLTCARSVGRGALRHADLLSRSRALLHDALGLAAGSGSDLGPMVEVMIAQTQVVLVAVEREAGDLVAATAAAAAAVAAYEPSFELRASAKNRNRLYASSETWLGLLLERGEATAFDQALARLEQTFREEGQELLRLAEWSAKAATAFGDTAAGGAARERGLSLLRACVAAKGCDAATLRDSPALACLRAHPGFAALLAAVGN